MAEPAPSLRKALSVGELNRRLKRLLEDNIGFVWVEGEISEYSVHGPSGHHYFKLKDEKEVLPCAMWRPHAAKLKFKPEVGLEVYAFGRPSIYPPRGTYQLIVEKMEPKGLGALQLRFEELKKKLKKEGLFDPKRKKPLPPFPRTVALVTSPTGAALRDMLRILTARFPKITALLCPVPVQGEGAADQVARAIGEINLQRPDVDVMIVGRGGGSLEDLWAFNEEAVARAIFSSKIPVISAVGHETDFTIADFVADLRAATPTEAAVQAVPDLREILETLADHERTILRRPRELFEQHSQRVDELEERLRNALGSAAKSLRDRLARNEQSLGAALPRLANETRRWLERDGASMRSALARLLRDSKQRLSAAEGRLDALSPLKVLDRGFSITQDGQGRVVRDARKLKPGDELITRLARGRARSRVEESLDDGEHGDTMSRP